MWDVIQSEILGLSLDLNCVLERCSVINKFANRNFVVMVLKASTGYEDATRYNLQVFYRNKVG